MASELRQLQHFLVVAEEGHISRAARRLHLTQPALSRSLHQLERALGVSLFRRHPGGVDITSAAVALLPKARAAIAAAEVALTPLDCDQALAGELRIGFLPPVTDAMARFIDEFQATNPDVFLQWQPLDFVNQLESLRAGSVDVALLWVPHADPDISFEPVATEPRSVLLSARNPLAEHDALTFEQIANEPHPGFPVGAPAPWADFWYLSDVRGKRPPLIGDGPLSVEDAWALVASGKAITVAPASLARTYARAGVVARTLTDVAPAVLAVAWRRQHTELCPGALVAFASRRSHRRRAGSAQQRPGKSELEA